jgi:hypothetical protein
LLPLGGERRGEEAASERRRANSGRGRSGLEQELQEDERDRHEDAKPQPGIRRVSSFRGNEVALWRVGPVW